MTIHVVMGFLLGFLGLILLTAAWWNEARRNDATDHDLAAIRAHLGIDQEEPVIDPDPATIPDGIPTQPSDLPLQVQSALLERPTPTAKVDTVEKELGGYTFQFRSQP